MQENLSLIELWRRWIESGPEGLSHVLLWHHHLFFWSRVGKGLEFVAALAIISDILGPERLRAWGRWLKSLGSDEQHPGLGLVTQGLIGWLEVIGVAYVIYRCTGLESFIRGGVLTKILLLFASLWVGLLVGALGGLMGFAITAGPFILFAWILDRANGDKWIKTTSLVMLLVGFHFDLLGS